MKVRGLILYCFALFLMILSGYIVLLMTHFWYSGEYDFDTGCPQNQSIECVKGGCGRFIFYMAGGKSKAPACTQLLCYNGQWFRCMSVAVMTIIFTICIGLITVFVFAVLYLVCMFNLCVYNRAMKQHS